MRFGRALVATSLLAAVFAPPTASATIVAGDPSTWTNRRLAAQAVIAGVSMSNLAAAESWARSGVGGVVLLGSPPSDLRARLTRVRAAGGAVPPFVASDEEGGQVQRLAPLIYRLPSAEYMGRAWPTTRVRSTALDYGLRMRAMGVDMALAPVADLSVPGYYIEQRDRGFSADPVRAGSYVTAWSEGLRAARVTPMLKHWPGHGQASDTHAGATTTPPLSTLEDRDMVPFDAAMQRGIPVVMVGHLNVPGLTEANTPASVSPAAMRYLRNAAGPGALVVTDSLAMAAVTGALRISTAEAAVRALRAGADMAMVEGDANAIIDRVQRALDAGEWSRTAAIASARRVLSVKRFTDAAPAPLSGPASAPSGDGALLAAYRVHDSGVVVRRVAGASWGAPILLGGRTASAPAIARAGQTTYVFVRGSDNYTYYRAGTSGSGWTGWTRLNTGSLVDAPAAVGSPDGTVHLAVRTSGNRLVVRTLTPGVGWGRNVDIGTTSVSPAVAETAAGELVVVARNDASRVLVRSRASRSDATWQPWRSMGGVTTAPPSVAADRASGRVVIAIRASDGRLYTNERSGSWSGWTARGGAMSAGPALAAVKDGTITLVIRSGDYNDLLTRSWTSGTWGPSYQRWY